MKSEQAAASRDVEQLLAELPLRQREAIRLTKIEGLSIDEAARRTDSPRRPRRSASIAV